jgi:hypothetical protein
MHYSRIEVLAKIVRLKMRKIKLLLRGLYLVLFKKMRRRAKGYVSETALRFRYTPPSYNNANTFVKRSPECGSTHTVIV